MRRRGGVLGCSVWLVTTAVGGCDAPSDPRGGGDEVSAREDAVSPAGSCVSPAATPMCGGAGEGTCWCDDACTTYGDCCGDAGEICGLDWPPHAPAPEPVPPPDSDEPPPVPQGPDVPDTPYCAHAAGWDLAWRQLEDEIVELTNDVRAVGADCGSAGVFGPAPAVVADAALRCSSRIHALDMDAQDYFAHENPAGEKPWDRMSLAGYDWQTAGENLAAGNASAEATMGQWLDSDGHCANLMNPNFTELGVGYVPGGPYGTNFATPK